MSEMARRCYNCKHADIWMDEPEYEWYYWYCSKEQDYFYGDGKMAEQCPHFSPKLEEGKK